MKMMIFGLGYSGRAIAEKLNTEQGAGTVMGTTRSAEKAEALSQAGTDAFIFDGVLTEDLKQALTGVTHLLLSAAPSESGDPVLPALGDDLKALMPDLQWIGYLSTVGVYGDFGGAWISETVEPAPVSKRGQWRVDAETAWRAAAKQAGVPFAIIRLAGIYGPGRSPLDKLRQGKSRRILKPGQVFNRIHVADIAQIASAAALKSASGVFNGADHEPAPPQTVIEYAASLIGMDPPPAENFDTAEMTPMARSFYSDNKRCGNSRLSKDLGMSLTYPTYREGLTAILEAEASR
ncbi:SDR family oxidoreductase [Cucumibacter marinus]|uniref:SDR family oxidoreductase n=1 Tax=Cucumibacter marinus TaxID=1121252 RepID=UPI00040F2A28|nr:SDR family oxidoreductase [Cucumibacter marinus]